MNHYYLVFSQKAAQMFGVFVVYDVSKGALYEYTTMTKDTSRLHQDYSWEDKKVVGEIDIDQAIYFKSQTGPENIENALQRMALSPEKVAHIREAYRNYFSPPPVVIETLNLARTALFEAGRPGVVYDMVAAPADRPPETSPGAPIAVRFVVGIGLVPLTDAPELKEGRAPEWKPGVLSGRHRHFAARDKDRGERAVVNIGTTENPCFVLAPNL